MGIAAEPVQLACTIKQNNPSETSEQVNRLRTNVEGIFHIKELKELIALEKFRSSGVITSSSSLEMRESQIVSAGVLDGYNKQFEDIKKSIGPFAILLENKTDFNQQQSSCPVSLDDIKFFNDSLERYRWLSSLALERREGGVQPLPLADLATFQVGSLATRLGLLLKELVFKPPLVAEVSIAQPRALAATASAGGGSSGVPPPSPIPGGSTGLGSREGAAAGGMPNRSIAGPKAVGIIKSEDGRIAGLTIGGNVGKVITDTKVVSQITDFIMTNQLNRVVEVVKGDGKIVLQFVGGKIGKDGITPSVLEVIF